MIIRLGLITCVLVTLAALFAGCATTQGGQAPLGPEETADAFFTHVIRSKPEKAYSLLAKGISQSIDFYQFERFMEGLQDEWGRMESAQTVMMPFHKRPGEENFIPLRVEPEQIERYIYEVTFERATMNFDITVAPQDGTPKIIWFSLWGSGLYLTPNVQDLLDRLFTDSGANPSLQ